MHGKTEPGTNSAASEINSADLLKRPEIHYRDLIELADIEGHGDSSIASQVEILVKYAGYINRRR